NDRLGLGPGLPPPAARCTRDKTTLPHDRYGNMTCVTNAQTHEGICLATDLPCTFSRWVTCFRFGTTRSGSPPYRPVQQGHCFLPPVLSAFHSREAGPAPGCSSPCALRMLSPLALSAGSSAGLSVARRPLVRIRPLNPPRLQLQHET